MNQHVQTHETHKRVSHIDLSLLIRNPIVIEN